MDECPLSSFLEPVVFLGLLYLLPSISFSPESVYPLTVVEAFVQARWPTRSPKQATSSRVIRKNLEVANPIFNCRKE